MHTNVASQRPQGRLSELEVDKLIGVFVSKLDQNRDRREPEQRGDASLGSLGQASDGAAGRSDRGRQGQHFRMLRPSLWSVMMMSKDLIKVTG